MFGGGGRIRTHGRHKTFNGFQGRRFRPLSHPSDRQLALNITYFVTMIQMALQDRLVAFLVESIESPHFPHAPQMNTTAHCPRRKRHVPHFAC
jgi:hypothetical protein